MNCALRAGMAVLESNALVALTKAGLDLSVLVNRELVALLLKAGAGSVEIDGMMGRTTAAQSALDSLLFSTGASTL